jgi:hypothetical protein
MSAVTPARKRGFMAGFGIASPTLRAGALVAVLLLSGCGHASSETSGRPTAPGQCRDLGTHRRDGFVLAGTDWSAEQHTYAESAVVYACVQPGTGGRVHLEASGQGITITPRSRATDSSDNGVLAFRVRVSRGATGGLTMHQESPGAATGGPGPTVVAGADGWHFSSTE